MASAFSGSDSDFLSSSSCCEASEMAKDRGVTSDKYSGTLETSISENGKDGSKLVLVEPCDLKVIKQEPGLEEEEPGLEEEERGGASSSDGSLAWFKDFALQLKECFDAYNRSQGQVEGFTDAMRALRAQMEILTGQMREVQRQFFKSSLSSKSTPPGSATSIKNENLFKAQEQVPQIPGKGLQPPMRHDVTPVSTYSDSEQQTGGGSSTLAAANPRRSLSFPKSLEAILDEDRETDLHGVTSRELVMRNGPGPSLSLAVTDRGRSESPNRDSKFGLLVLADAALTRTPESSTYVHRTGESFTDYDSGRSSGNSCRSSPSVSQDALKVKGTDKFARYGVYNNNNDLHASKRSHLGSSSSSSTADSKLRKRRKMKEPLLPCNFCGKCFNIPSRLRQHESFHRPERPFKCENEKCDKAYKTRSDLNRHLVVHSGEKYECKMCGKRFLRKQYLKTHLLRHHETGIAMIAPSAIDSFKDDSSGRIPSIVVSSSFVSKTEPLTWRCQMCFKIFVDNDDLTRHVRSYHDKKKGTDGKQDIVNYEEQKQ